VVSGVIYTTKDVGIVILASLAEVITIIINIAGPKYHLGRYRYQCNYRYVMHHGNGDDLHGTV